MNQEKKFSCACVSVLVWKSKAPQQQEYPLEVKSYLHRKLLREVLISEVTHTANGAKVCSPKGAKHKTEASGEHLLCGGVAICSTCTFSTTRTLRP
jgi:hypothetical protein